MSKSKPLVDEKCLELAKHFLSDIHDATSEDAWSLAYEIQRTCEDFCQVLEEDR